VIAKAVSRAKLGMERARARFPMVDVAMTTFKRFSQDDGGAYAAALTYYTFLSIFPLLLFGLSALGYLTLGNERLQADIIDAGLKAAPMLGDILQRNALEALQDRRGDLAITGLALALYSGSGAIVALEHALNRLHHVTVEPTFVAKRLRSLRWLAVLGGAAVASMALSSVAAFTGRLFGGLGPVGELVTSMLSLAAALVVSALVFATAYRFLPAAQQSWRQVAPGAILAAAIFEMLKLVGGTYLRGGSQNRTATFGVFATAASLLIASYLVSQVTLLCAELNIVLAERRLTRQSQGLAHRSSGGTS
jgi:membrane protein